MRGAFMCQWSWFWKIFTPEWLTAIGTVGAVIVALILAVWGEEIKTLFVRPKLSLKAHVRRPDSERTRRQNKLTGEDAGTAYFFRLAILNRGNTAAHDVQVFLASVRRAKEDSMEKVSEFTPMNLNWAYRGNATLPALLPRMPPVYCDLAHVDQPIKYGVRELFTEQHLDGAKLELDVEFPPNTLGHVLEGGTYHFHLILAAANCAPRHFTLEVVFSGKWFVDEEKMLEVGFKMRAV